MNKDFIKRLTVVAVILTLATASLVAGTFAKYTTEIKGTAEARVARFDVSAVLASGGEETATFGLFDTILDTKDNSDNGTPDYIETDVATSSTEKIIAPGTKGSFDIVLKNNSEVTVEYAIAFTGDLKSVPLEFRIYDKTTPPQNGDTGWIIMGSPKGEDQGAFSLADLNQGNTIEISENPTEITYTVDWRWVFEKFDKIDDDDVLNTARDTADTLLGEAGTATPTVTATVTFTQVD